MPRLNKQERCYIFDRWHMEFVRRFYIGRDRQGHPIPGADYKVTTTTARVIAYAYKNANCAARRAAMLNDQCGGRQRYVVLDEAQASTREKYMDTYRRRAGL